MKRVQTKGTCQLCKGTFGKAGMTKHLAVCLQKSEADGTGKGSKEYLVRVQGTYSPQYWLILGVGATASLYDLDAFLRDIWLECCGHLSMFTIKGVGYSVDVDDWDPQGRTMEVAASQILKPGVKFSHDYDFGSTTKLILEVVGERPAAKPRKEKVRLLARNQAPDFACGECGKPAAFIDSSWSSEEPWLCKSCAKKYDECLLPVVNSPRVGVCGYTGKD